MVLKAEGLTAEDGFVDSLSLSCDGSLRDVYQLLEQLILSAGNEPLSVGLLEEAVGVISTARYKDLAQVLCFKSYGLSEGLRMAVDEVNRWHQEGYDLQHLFLTGVPILLRDFMVCLSGCYQDGVGYLSGISHESFTANVTLVLEDVSRFTSEWDRTERMMRMTAHPRIIWEAFLIKSFFDVGIVEGRTSEGS
jgi:DNA polymerase III gamma/tau subunit